MKVYFYTLSDPITDEICYVGQTIYPDKREKQHKDLRSFGGNANKYRWINGLAGRQLEPVFTIICEAIDLDVIRSPQKLEAEIISSLWDIGCPLLNKQSTKGNRSKRNYVNWCKRIRSARFYQLLGFDYL